MDSSATTFYTHEQNMHLIDLAHECVFINSSEKKKAVRFLQKNSKEQTDLNIIDFFQQEKFVSDKRIEYLLAFDAHLQLHRRDQQFGRIAIANGLASKKDVSKALEYQKNYFYKNQINIKIGNILISNGGISAADRVLILITQNRIKDDSLFDALNEIGETQAQKDAVNRRLGALAMRMELATPEQIKTALKIQRLERETQKKARFIGQILQETANLSNDDIVQLLLEQKQFEKRRVDLEKNLYTVKSEIRISQKLNKLFEYRISRDGLEAFVKKKVEIDEAIPVYEFLIWLRRAGIKFGVVNDIVLEEFINKAEKNSQILIARGYPPSQCIDEGIQFYFKNESAAGQLGLESEKSEQVELDQPESDQKEGLEKQENTENKTEEKNQPEKLEKAEQPPDDQKSEENKTQEGKGAKEENNDDNRDKKKVTHPKSDNQQHDNRQQGQNENTKEIEEPVYIKKGTLVAQIIPGKKGKPGKDVLGYPIQPKKPSIYMLNAGSGVIRKGVIFIAQTDGRPVLKNPTTIVVEPVARKTRIKTIKGDISCDTKNNYESAKVEMTGTITSEAVFKCHSLLLHGSVLGCVISVDKVDIKGNIGTDQKPKGEATIHQANIICQGSINVSKSIINSNIQTAGELLASHSTLIGSEVVAFKGMTIQNVLKGEHAPSTLWIGLKPNDKIIAIDHTLDIKKNDLSILQKKDDIAQLKEQYQTDLKQENLKFEQAIFKNLIEIIQAPELYQSEGLKEKIKYLYSLPEFSSIRTYYLKIPESKGALKFLDQIITLTRDMSLDEILSHIQKKIDPEPENVDKEGGISNLERIKIDFKARLASFEQEIKDQSEEIEKIENEIKGLQALRKKLGLMHITSLPQSISAVNIKNKCEKGTIIKGNIAKHIVKQTVYNVIFKEIIDPVACTALISIETY